METIESLPLFPLADVVLLPEVSVPLILFEPRYRQLARDVLAGERLIGMIAVPPEHVGEMPGDPPLFEIGCVGRITQGRRRRDGTFQILLVGLSRFRILQEAPRPEDRLYRSARVEILSDELPTDPNTLATLEERRRVVLRLLERLVRNLDRSELGRRALSAFEDIDPIRLVNTLTQSIGLRPIERQRLLEADSILGRFEIMADLLRFRLAEVASGAPDSGPLPH